MVEVHFIEGSLVGIVVSEGELLIVLMVVWSGVSLPEFEIGEWSFLFWFFVLVVGEVSWGFLIFFLFESFEGAGGFLPEGKIREVLVFGRRDD